MKKAIVIGASSGIGKALAQALAREKYLVGLTGRRTAMLEDLKAENPQAYQVMTMDVTTVEALPRQLDELVKTLGGLDLLVLSSGTGDVNVPLDFAIEKRTIDTNVLGFTCIADWAFNYFQQQKQGHFVAITSVAGLRGGRHAPAYNASKAYQVSYLQALRHKAAHLKLPIAITDVRPGFVDTAMAKGEGVFWSAPVEKAAAQMMAAIRRKKKVAYITRRWSLVAAIMQRAPDFVYHRT